MNKTLDRVRQFVAKTYGFVPENSHAVTWITEFPMFEYNEDESRSRRCTTRSPRPIKTTFAPIPTI